MNKQQFMANVEQAQKHIQEGDIFQVVLSQRMELRIQRIHWMRMSSFVHWGKAPICIILILMNMSLPVFHRSCC